MFVKQIEMHEALRLAAAGQEIKIMAPNTSEPKRWTDYTPNTLDNLLDGCLFFRDEPAMDNPEFDGITHQALPRPAKPESETQEETPPKSRNRVDRGKVLALHKAGRSIKWIADDMGLHEGTVYRVLREMKEENHGKADT